MFKNLERFVKYQRNYSTSFKDSLLNSQEPFRQNAKEIQLYKDLAAKYWNDEGITKRFHSFNRVRIPLIYSCFCPSDTLVCERLQPRIEFKNISILDVGCGGGICAEALAKLNFNVAGIDPNPDMIKAAEKHRAENRELKGKTLQYYEMSIEEFAQRNVGIFDAVIISDILEYVPAAKKKQFIHNCVKCCKVNGQVFVTTVNDTWLSLFRICFYILLREYNPAPIKLTRTISPDQLDCVLQACGCFIVSTRGIRYNHEDNEFEYNEDLEPWYFVNAVKRGLISE